MDEVIKNLEQKSLIKSSLESAILLPPNSKISDLVLTILLDSTITEEEDVDLAVKILKRGKLIVPKDVFLMALQSPSDAVKALALDQLLNQDYSRDFEILDELLNLVQQGSISIAMKATSEFVQLSKNQDYNNFYFQFQSRFKSTNAIEYSRICNLVVSLAILSPESFKALDKLEATMFAREFSTKDLLLALNMIEIFNSISSNDGGYEFLKKTGVLDRFEQLLDESEPGLIVRAIVKFWGLLLFSNPGYCKEHTKIVPKLIELCNDSASKDEVLVCLGNIGSTNLGLEFLFNEHEIMQIFIESFKSHNKINSLRTLACFLSNNTERVGEICHQITKRISTTPAEFLLTFSKSPIEELSVAAFACLKELSRFTWGLRELQASKYQSLLDRSDQPALIRVFVSNQEWKYSIVESMVENAESEVVFGKREYEKLHQFTLDGPFGTDYNPEVATATR